MAEKNAAKNSKPAEAAASAASAAAPARRKFPLKTLLVLGAVLLLEGLTITAAFLLSGGPAQVEASSAAMEEQARAQQPTEVLVIEDRFQNTRAGVPYIYDTRVVAVVQYRHQAKVKDLLETIQGQIVEDVSTIIRRAELAHLREPTLATIKLQVKTALDQRLGKDEEGNPIVESVLIPRCTEFRGDM